MSHELDIMKLDIKEMNYLKNNLESMGFSSYDEFLKSEWWVMKREAIFEAKGKKCEICGSKYGIEIHHKTYEHLGNEPLKDIMVVCHACHLKLHKGTIAEVKPNKFRSVVK